MSSVVHGKRGAPKTEARENSVPLIPWAKQPLDMYRLRLGNPTSGIMFPTGGGTPLDLHNVFADRIDPVLNVCEECGQTKAAHLRKRCRKENPHECKRRDDPIAWHGWHAPRRGLGSNLNELGVPDLTIQRILRYSNVNTTRKSYIKVRDPQVLAAMAQLEAEVRRVETVGSEAKIQKAQRVN
jgi:hypothetical protein